MITFKEFFEENTSPLAPAIFVGWQTIPGRPTEPLFNTTQDIDLPENDKQETLAAHKKVAAMMLKYNKVLKAPRLNYPEGTTLGKKTLETLGYYVPNIPEDTPKNTPLVDDRKIQTEAAPTKKNVFGFHQRKELKPSQGQKRLPQKVYKKELKAKQNKRDLIKPRRWHVNAAGRLIRLFQ